MICHGCSVYFAWLFCRVTMCGFTDPFNPFPMSIMIISSFTPCYTMICITFLMLFIPLTLTPGSLFYSLVYLVYCLTLSPPTSAQETY